jgi:hypothetical protein
MEEGQGENIEKVVLIDEDEYNRKKVPAAPPLPNGQKVD